MRRRPLLLSAVLVVAIVAAVTLLRDRPAGPADPVTSAPPRTSAGLVATTGDPDKADVALPDRPEFDTSGEGLEVEPSPVPGGGVMIDLQGRFQHAVTAVVADSDSVVVECLPDSGAAGGEGR